MSPDWTKSPHHVAAGAVLALLVYVIARRRLPWTWSAALAVVVTMAGEAFVELVEYPLVYDGPANASSYYDIVGDITASFFGGVTGTALGLLGTAVRRRRLSRARRSS